MQLRNGSVLEAELAAPPGSLENPADEGILGKKFLALSENVLGKVRAQKAIDVILSVERMSSLKDFLMITLLRGNCIRSFSGRFALHGNKDRTQSATHDERDQDPYGCSYQRNSNVAHER